MVTVARVVDNDKGGTVGAAENVIEQAEPVFASAHGALKFALNYTHGTLKKSFLAQAMGKSVPGRGLGGLDGAAQAGMIRAEIGQLAELKRNIIIAKFAPHSSPCPCKSMCCRGWRESDDWKEAINELTEYVLEHGLTGTVSHYRLRRALVMRYFGVHESFLSMADTCGVSRNTAGQYNKAVVEHFRGEEKLAFYEIEGRLKAAGMVP